MLNLVDSSGWIEYLTDGENAGFFERAISDTQLLVVPAICFYEVFKRIAVNYDEEEALRAIGIMGLGQEVGLDRTIALNAASISLQFKLAMADSIILATAQSKEAILWTQDQHFKDLPGVEYIEKKIG